MKKNIKKFLITGMLFLGSLNFCFGANIQCWEEYRTPWDSQVMSWYSSNSNKFSASDSKLYNTLKDKATVIFVGTTGYTTTGTNSSDGGITTVPTSYILAPLSYGRPTRVQADSIILNFCAVFNDSGSSSSSTSTSSTAAVNYIIKAK